MPAGFVALKCAYTRKRRHFTSSIRWESRSGLRGNRHISSNTPNIPRPSRPQYMTNSKQRCYAKVTSCSTGYPVISGRHTKMVWCLPPCHWNNKPRHSAKQAQQLTVCGDIGSKGVEETNARNLFFLRTENGDEWNSSVVAALLFLAATRAVRSE